MPYSFILEFKNLNLLKPNQCWESLNSKSFSEFLLLSSINFTQLNVRIDVSQLLSGLDVFRLKSFTMSAPRGIYNGFKNNCN